VKNVQSSVESPSVRNRISSRGIAALGAAILVASAGSAMAQSAPQTRPATQTASAAGETEIGRKRDAVEPVQTRPVDAKPVNRAPVAQPVIAPVVPVTLADTSDDVWNERARAAYAAVDVLDLGLETNASVAVRAQATLGYIDLPTGLQGEFDVAHATNALPQ
jgi:hypothetical protein